MSPLKQTVEPSLIDKAGESAPVSAESDERVALVQRILASSGFQRAVQLRNILTYTTTAAILRPDEQVREYEIACDVLGRREDFDPVNDNIVRSQMSHLRRKLDAYFADEGRHETLKLTFPRGGYVPVFRQVTVAPSETPGAMSAEAPLGGATQPTAPEVVSAGANRWKLWFALMAAVAGISISVCLVYIARSWRTPPAASVTSRKGNEFVQFLGRATGSVSIVLPDTSLMLIQNLLQTDIALDDYTRPDFLDKQIAGLPSPELRKTVFELRSKRNTSAGEAIVAAELQDAVERAGISGTLRYARDLRVRDLDEGNSILIGSGRSNPWTSLFYKRLNYRYDRRPSDHQLVFLNEHPGPGESAEYVPFEQVNGKFSSYVDVALVPNLTQSGFVLLISGSDSQANEAAARFLLRGQLPPELTAILAREHPTYFEVFLRGKHSNAEGEEQFEVVSVRSSPPASH